MRIAVIPSLLLCAALLPACGAHPAPATEGAEGAEDPSLAEYNKDLPRLGAQLPAIDALRLDGTGVTNASLKGKTVLLNVWFIHCPSCRQELPRVQVLQQQLQGRDDVAILALNSGDDSRDAVAAFWKESGFTFPALMDAQAPRTNSGVLGVAACPTNIVVGPDGKVLHASVGFNEPLIRKLLGAPAKG